MQLKLSIIACIALITQSAIGCSFVFNREAATPLHSHDDTGRYVSAHCDQSCGQVRPNYWFLSTLRKLMSQAEDVYGKIAANHGFINTHVVQDGGDGTTY